MLTFIIYEDNLEMRNSYIKIIHQFMGNRNDNYKIEEFASYDKCLLKKIENIVGNRIFIFDIEVPGKSGIDLARDIRNSGDWKSPIIIVTVHSELRNESYRSKTLLLDFISKYSNFEEELKEALTCAIKITTADLSISFQQDGEIYKVPYSDILYIEKIPNQNYCNIVTKSNKYSFKQSIQELKRKLEKDSRFIQTHRSCIINIHNLTKIILSENLMIFKGGKESYLISREYKKNLKDFLLSKGG